MDENNKPYLLYCHCRFESYDPRSWHPNPMKYDKPVLPWHVKLFLESFQDKFRIVFITTQPKFDQSLLKDYKIDHFIKRKNEGFDFMGWKMGFDYLKSKKYFSKTILANDSIFIRKEHLNVIDKYINTNYDYVGTSLNKGHGSMPAHIQSMFLIVSENLIKSYVWNHFWQNMVKPDIDKQYAIYNNEVGLSNNISKCNFKLAAMNDTIFQGWSCPEFINKPNPFLKIKENEILYMMYKLKYYGL